jgi:2,4-dienoyl-CoA reductase-like NADH-dependent reductase (Old Yellow Enzyme family)
VPASNSPAVFSPAKLGPVTLRNRIIKAATFEGRTPRGLVTDDLIRFHRQIAAGGVGMTTLAFCAVTADGRQFAPMIQMRPEARPGLRRLTQAVHAEGAAASVQLGHAGVVSSSKSTGLPALGPSKKFDLQNLRSCGAATRADLRRITGAFGDATELAIESGFDSVEIHLGHDYLPSSFLSPRLNKRADSYGGSLENRARLAREIARTVRERAGDRIAVIGKLTMDDGVRGGFRVGEAVQVARWLEADSSLDALELTMGSSPGNTMYMFRGDPPIKEFAAAMSQPRKLMVRVAGRLKLKAYRYEPLYMLETARRIRAAAGLPLILLGGITERAHMDTAMAEGFQFVAMGRALLREPGLVNKIKASPSHESLCIHCNKCMPTIFAGGTHCVFAT